MDSAGTVYVGDSVGKLYALRPSGTLEWSYPTGGTISCAPAIATDGTVYITTDSLIALTPSGSLDGRACAATGRSPGRRPAGAYWQAATSG